MMKYQSLYEVLGENIKRIIADLSETEMDRLEEIRLRQGLPLQIKANVGRRFLRVKGSEYRVTAKDISECLTLISGYSTYAFEEEIRNGFITISGGHRAGICGRVVMENNLIQTMRSISSINIRVSHEVKNCADSVMRYIIDNDTVRHSLIVSPPRCGKTTILRDIVRQLSNGVPALNFIGVDVSVVDERSEIAGSYMGKAQNDVGMRTDVLDSCPKALGMSLLLRSMSPTVIAVDEIGRKEDIYAIEDMLNAGIKLICTVHGNDLEDIKRRAYLGRLIEQKRFERIIVLYGLGKVREIYDEKLQSCYKL